MPPAIKRMPMVIGKQFPLESWELSLSWSRYSFSPGLQADPRSLLFIRPSQEGRHGAPLDPGITLLPSLSEAIQSSQSIDMWRYFLRNLPDTSLCQAVVPSGPAYSTLSFSHKISRTIRFLYSLTYPIGWQNACKMSWHPPPKIYIHGIALKCSSQQAIGLHIAISHSS